MNKYAVTFQQRYRHDIHPIIPKVTEHSYLIIEAETEYEARIKTHALLGKDWAFLYPWDKMFRLDIVKYDLTEVTLDG